MLNLKQLHQDESGITALEVVLILIAYIMIVSVAAFTILVVGTSSMQPGGGSTDAGSRSPMAIRGSVIARGDSGKGSITSIIFTVGLAPGGDPIDFNADDDESAVVIDYRDAERRMGDMPFSVAWVGAHQNDSLLEPGELAEINVDLASLNPSLGTSRTFSLEVRSAAGTLLDIRRTTPATMATVNELR